MIPQRERMACHVLPQQRTAIGTGQRHQYTGWIYISQWFGPFIFQGTSIGKCPKNKLFKGYIELELQLREFDRCRKLYEKFLEFGPENCTSWIKFAELETILGDIERARAIYELAISQPRLDMPEVRLSKWIFCFRDFPSIALDDHLHVGHFWV